MDAALNALIKPVVDALLAALKAARGKQLKRSAAKDLSAAVRELLTANPNDHYAEAKIAAAKAAGLLNEDLFLAEKLLDASKAQKNAANRRGKTSKAAAKPLREKAPVKTARQAKRSKALTGMKRAAKSRAA